MDKKIEEDKSININATSDETDKRIEERIKNYLSSLSIEEKEEMSKRTIASYNKKLRNTKPQ